MNNGGLKIEVAASIVARDLITKHLQQFSYVIRKDRHTGREVVAAYVDGLAGAVALTVAGGQGSKDEIVMATINAFCNAVERDLKHLKVQR